MASTIQLGDSVSTEAFFGGTDVLSGSLLPTNVTINSSSDGYFISSSSGGGPK